MKALIVGLGGVGQRHVRNLVSLLGDRLELIAYRTRRLSTVLTDRLQVEPGSELESKYRIRAFTDLDAALGEKPQAAFICNPSRLHIPVALKAAAAGCHLFLEKPLSDSLEGVGELIETVEARQLVAVVGYQLRFHPCLVKLKAILSAGLIGRPLAVRAEVGEYLPGWHTYEDYRQMYASRSDLGGGVILSQIHELDYLYSLFGLPRRIFAVGGHLSPLEIDVEDVASILMACQVDHQEIPIHLHQDYLQRPPERTCQVIGERGKIWVDFNGLSVRLYDAQGDLCEETLFEGFQRNQLFIDELQHFLACIRGEAKPIVSVRDGAQSLRIALAAKESLVRGEAVAL